MKMALFVWKIKGIALIAERLVCSDDSLESLLQQMFWEKCIHYRSSSLFFVCVLMYNSQCVEYCFKGFTAVLFRQHRAPGVWYNRGRVNI